MQISSKYIAQFIAHNSLSDRYTKQLVYFVDITIAHARNWK